MTPTRRNGIMVLAIAAVSLRAEARTYKIDVHPSTCQLKVGEGTLDYSFDRYVQALGGWVNIVCPVPLMTMPGDAASGSLSFLVVYDSATKASLADTDVRCGLMYQWTDKEYLSGWLPADYDNNSNNIFSSGHGTLKSVGVAVDLPTPVLNQPPFQLSFHCILPDKAKLEAIQILTN